jgi:hypothetical protein
MELSMRPERRLGRRLDSPAAAPARERTGTGWRLPHAAAESDEPRKAIANVLSGLGVRDARILPILIETLEDDVMLGAGLLAEYGDPAALPDLEAALNGFEPDARGGLFANQEISRGGVLSRGNVSPDETVNSPRRQARSARASPVA